MYPLTETSFEKTGLRSATDRKDDLSARWNLTQCRQLSAFDLQIFRALTQNLDRCEPLVRPDLAFRNENVLDADGAFWCHHDNPHICSSAAAADDLRASVLEVAM